MLGKGTVKTPFSVVQWHGEDYPYYEDDAHENTFNKGDEVLVIMEAESNPMGKLYVVYNPKINESTVVAESYLEIDI